MRSANDDQLRGPEKRPSTPTAGALALFWLKQHWASIAIGLAVTVLGPLYVLTARVSDGVSYEGTVERAGVVQTGRWHWHPQPEIVLVKLNDGRLVSAQLEQGRFARVGEHVVVHRYSKLMGSGVEYRI